MIGSIGGFHCSILLATPVPFNCFQYFMDVFLILYCKLFASVTEKGVTNVKNTLKSVYPVHWAPLGFRCSPVWVKSTLENISNVPPLAVHGRDRSAVILISVLEKITMLCQWFLNIIVFMSDLYSFVQRPTFMSYASYVDSGREFSACRGIYHSGIWTSEWIPEDMANVLKPYNCVAWIVNRAGTGVYCRVWSFGLRLF